MIEVETTINDKVKIAATKQSLLFYLKLLVYVMVAIVATGVIILVSDLDKTVGISLIIAGVLVPLFILGLSYLSIARKIKKASGAECAVQNVKFGDKIILSEKSEKFCANNNEIDYSLIIKAAETMEYFFLFLNAFALIIIDKNGFKEGSVNELRAFLSAKLSKKFCIKAEKLD